MKLLIFAHTPPPYHGQSYAVKLMLDNFGGDRRKSKFRNQPPNRFGIECYHVNARFSKTLEDIGEFQLGKILLILFYCLQAVWCRLRYGADNFFYIPAPGKPVALYRDWLVMLVCRPFFKHVIFNWRAAGLAKWLETAVSIRTRSFTFNRMKNADVSIVLSDFSRRDAEKLMARRIVTVAGGIPDPCPKFETEILPQRRARIIARKKILSGEFQNASDGDKTVNVLYLALVSREKGAFDAVEAVALANENFPLRFRLTIIGGFASKVEETELHELIRRRGLKNAVEILGFVSAERKFQALRDADLFCFPSYYLAEGQPASLIEALALGLPIVTTRWRAIPEMLPEDYPGIVNPKSPGQIAEKLRLLATSDISGQLREIFLRRFTIEQHLAKMAEAFHSVETP
ncbi:MAG TPA: glycosyltransferase family 4 protein [Dongiaceae bacterium]|jgi:glycosyltransferase involved in cell wall biosynthesis|nr:glycosyltransferase family 4 protein [Dongiaceae bacterium]